MVSKERLWNRKRSVDLKRTSNNIIKNFRIMEKMKISITAPSMPKNIPGIGYKKLRDRGIIVLN
jgi:hypothetical protein